MAGLKTIIALSFVLAIGFLLVILSSALYGNWLPLFVVAIYLLAPLPNALCSKLAGEEDFMSDSTGSGLIDFGRFVTGMLVVSGITLPVLLNHVRLIVPGAMVMSTVGGLVIYGTIIAYTQFFAREGDDF
ncbi:Vacuolar protein sorting-associated protein 55 [Saitoella coloradoensis]|uniref:vacuolar protein sorting 55 superfamily n=1 Tax=Saitoella complicata (strain BCRC 22490 / CBS 7301 / JCM 7358 / NBRC 10748 / NRRL Y-17804) TaxID=698492 RepID=UPI000867B0FD|nr:vacuolar protein sorting 55 superfamily [Saitoella complicata NRRL Y-17804]ODQ51965.1 vacuolar protein sorting 55 superfamily [Saitoella complicata NRRL Y-17804]